MKIIFFDGTTGFYPTRLEEKPTGGILTSLTLIPRYLASRGMDVTVLSVHKKEETVNGVHYINEFKGKCDIAIFNRNFFDHDALKAVGDAEKWWWLHDIVDFRYLRDSAYQKMDRVVALSQYCMDSFSDYYGIERSPAYVFGVDKVIRKTLGGIVYDLAVLAV